MKRGFTLIELLAVIVILAILALITVPIVLKLVENARRDSAIRSAENYLDGVKKTVMNDAINTEVEIEECIIQKDGNLICNGNIPLTVDVDGKKPTSGIISFSGDTIGEVVDIKIGKYYISTQDNQLVATTKISEGEDGANVEYKKGDIIYVHKIPFFVIKNSLSTQDYIVAMKSIPLTVGELNMYGKNIINRYKNNEAYLGSGFVDGQTYDIGLMAYYNDADCGYKNGQSSSDGCTNSYAESDVKKVVDKWMKAVFQDNDLKVVNGYKARLITYDELTKEMRYGYNNADTVDRYLKVRINSAPEKYQWINGYFTYWTMSPYYDYDDEIWFVSSDHLIHLNINSGGNIAGVRPVINVYKSAID